MTTSKVPQQPLRPDELSRRVMPSPWCRDGARSHLFAEAVKVWPNRRNGGQYFEGNEVEVAAVELRLFVIGRGQRLFWNTFASTRRYQFNLASTVTSAGDGTPAAAARLFIGSSTTGRDAFVANEGSVSQVSIVKKLRRLH